LLRLGSGFRGLAPVVLILDVSVLIIPKPLAIGSIFWNWTTMVNWAWVAWIGPHIGLIKMVLVGIGLVKRVLVGIDLVIV
jgi:hypothetical protein